MCFEVFKIGFCFFHLFSLKIKQRNVVMSFWIIKRKKKKHLSNFNCRVKIKSDFRRNFEPEVRRFSYLSREHRWNSGAANTPAEPASRWHNTEARGSR